MASRRLPLFVFGTLLDADIRAAVLGPRWRRRGRPARLIGFEKLYVAGEAYPALRRRPGATCKGALLPAPDDLALARLDRHEGAEYRRGAVYVATGGKLRRADCYLTAEGTTLARIRWRQDARWRRGAAAYRRRQFSAGSSRTTA